MAEALWTIDELLAATGGRLHGSVTERLTAVTIDSRAVGQGDIFVAIKGGKHDGHDFVASALKAGAGLGLVSRVTPEMLAAGPVLEVADDPLRGLEKMGVAARARSEAQIVAVTGSVGKTSTKEMLRTALSASGGTHASAASFNNHWGVPLTLARLPRSAAFGVFEIGMNHAGEITPLVGMVRPHVAIITAIAASHLGNFASLGEIADAKAEIFTGIVQWGSAVISRDTPYFERLSAAAWACGVRSVVSFGKHPDADVRMERVALLPDCCCVTADVMGETVSYKLGLPGEHMAVNSLAVLATTKLTGADLARAALALAKAAPAKGRGVRERLSIAGGELLLIDESYNANPASVAAALGLLGAAQPQRGGRRIAVLGDMLELGEQSPELHAGLLEPMDAAKVDVLYAAGPLMANLWARVPEGRRGAYAESSEGLRDVLLKSLKAGDAVMIKGSLGSRMGPLVEAIRAAHPPLVKET
ncbi:MAG: UDP-N-acetylmuramoylalanyl-D-glutamyl-2,6-diaminopimelate--D-alanyl-D-alanine ligase [Aestuariivirga sp.]|uniref:UDP-N-acetylmuramoylalanyl-D-glutamyl-2, 6-diaminopimelate--D-alanyl-D-alanine ligase n=1 Tax=Aestuariivirga sp. TaxID=2650926 RepID=UPI0025C5009C|nr:UDP-N-acetylmuramoylalanyl-D-glutamyl-2,6-diaminopimelate--D-alanyl-D-alanine ligase [Aestuariivirga sp.]MCA3560424.1 UDP-N-acetylmuramoylalanyl-D-glutamyl-2,6-diaminopimelate--D-alanyl-D-alanine ligase [Aestuariivirga sp.]